MFSLSKIINQTKITYNANSSCIVIVFKACKPSGGKKGTVAEENVINLGVCGQ